MLLEGAGALRRDLREEWDDRLWLDCTRALRVERGLARDGEGQRELWLERWLPAGDRYELEHRPRAAADLVLDGSGRVPHDATRELVLLT